MATLDVLNLKGQKTGTVKIPATLMTTVNTRLLNQAVHVSRSNVRRGLAKAMTRGESGKTTAKLYRQKHTGRARHGSKSAPIFVGGGVAHGPTGRQNYSRNLPKKMRRLALISALSQKLNQKQIVVLDDLKKVEPKARAFRNLVKILGLAGRSLLFSPETKMENLKRALRNFPQVSVIPVSNLNSSQILAKDIIIMTTESIGNFGPHPNKVRLSGAGAKKGKKS
jgi:large subunit ribosomal protein L4